MSKKRGGPSGGSRASFFCSMCSPKIVFASADEFFEHMDTIKHDDRYTPVDVEVTQKPMPPPKPKGSKKRQPTKEAVNPEIQEVKVLFNPAFDDRNENPHRYLQLCTNCPAYFNTLLEMALHQLNTGHICYTKPLEPEEDEPMEVIEDDVNVASTSGGPKDTADEQSKAVASVSSTKLITESVELMELGEEHDDDLNKAADEPQQQQASTSGGPKDSGPSKPQMASSSSLSPPPIKPKRVKTSLIFDAEQPSTSSGNTGASKAVIKRFLTREAKASAPVAPKMPSKRATLVTVDPPPSTTTEEEDRWICHYCYKTYATLPLLAKHQQNWPGIHLTCIYCGRLVLQADLEAHLGEFHGTSSKKPLKK